MRGRIGTWAACCAAGLLFFAAPGAQADLVGLWLFDEGTGTVAADSSDNGLDGSLLGETWDGSNYVTDVGELPQWVSGVNGSALAFESDLGVAPFARQSVLVPFDSLLDLSGDFTVSAWIYYDSNGTGQFFESGGGSIYATILFRFDSYYFQARNQSDANFYAWDAFAGDFQNGFACPNAAVDTWQHVAFVSEGGTMSLYIDGVLQDSQPTGDPSSNSADLRIGTNLFQSRNQWNGMIDEVAIFSQALTTTELADVMAGDFSGFLDDEEPVDPDAIPTVPPGAPVGATTALLLLGAGLALTGLRVARK